MYRAGSRRRLIVAGASAIIAAACGRRGADSAGPAHRWLPPARIELWLGGTAAPVEHVIRTTVLPALRAVHPTIRVTVAGTAPPGQSPPQNSGSSGWGLASPGQAAGMNPSVLGSAGGRLSGTSSLSLRGPTADGDAHNRLIADHAAGLTSDVIPAGTGNLSTVRHLRAARVVNHRDLVEDLRQDFVEDAVAHLTTDAGPLGVPWLANPRRYVWRTDTLAALGTRIPQTWEDVVQACVRSSAGRPRSVGRRLLAVNGLHLDFYEALRHRGVWAIEYGKAAFAGDEGTAIARFFADRGQTDTIGRYGSGMTWGSDLSGQGVAGAWTTLAGLMRVITQATGAGPLVSVGAPVGAGGRPMLPMRARGERLQRMRGGTSRLPRRYPIKPGSLCAPSSILMRWLRWQTPPGRFLPGGRRVVAGSSRIRWCSSLWARTSMTASPPLHCPHRSKWSQYC